MRAEVARRAAAVTVSVNGGPDACHWIALSNQLRQVHVVGTLAREDGGLPAPSACSTFRSHGDLVAAATASQELAKER